MTPFPHPAHRTGRRLSDKVHALLLRATPFAVSEHSSGLIGCPICRSFATYCVCLEPRSLPSSGITRLPRYTNPSATPGRPACPSLASGRSPLTTQWGFPCCARFPCVHAVATTAAQRLGPPSRPLTPAVSAFPERVVWSACALSFSGIAQRSLALRPAHSRCHQSMARIPKASAISLPP